MPYATCRTCGLTVYSAARSASIDHCPSCGAELDRDWRDRSLLRATQRAQARQASTTSLPAEPSSSSEVAFRCAGQHAWARVDLPQNAKISRATTDRDDASGPHELRESASGADYSSVR